MGSRAKLCLSAGQGSETRLEITTNASRRFRSWNLIFHDRFVATSASRQRLLFNSFVVLLGWCRSDRDALSASQTRGSPEAAGNSADDPPTYKRRTVDEGAEGTQSPATMDESRHSEITNLDDSAPAGSVTPR